jgi:hypothetical protein
MKKKNGDEFYNEEQEVEEKYELKACASACQEKNVECPFSECKHWIKWGQDNNCDLVAIKKNGEMTLREIGERLGISYVRVKQIESAAIKKIKKHTTKDIFKD